METGEFVKKVKVRAGLPDNNFTGEVIDAVFGALRARIGHEAGDNIAEQLPRDIKLLWESGFMEHVARSMGGFERMDLNEFLEKVQNTAHLPDRSMAESVTRAVFSTMREQITSGADRIVQSQLPADIRDFWMRSTPEEREALPQSFGIEEETRMWGPEVDIPTGADVESARQEAKAKGQYDSSSIGPSAASLYRSDDQIASEIRQLLDASDELDAHDVNVHVHAGQVTLQGTVRTPNERNAAVNVACDALGTTDVNNELIILEEH